MSPSTGLRAGSLLEPLHDPGTTNVFVHAPSSVPHPSAVRRRIPDMDSAADRGLLLARPHDVVCVPRPVEAEYLAYLERFGIGPQARRIVVGREGPPGGLTRSLTDSPDLLEQVARAIDPGTSVRVSCYVSSPREDTFATRLSARLGREVEVMGASPALLRRVYRKDVMWAAARGLGIPVAPGERVHSREPGDAAALLDAVRRQSARTGRALVRGVFGTSSSSTWVLHGGDPQLRDRLDQLTRATLERVFLVDEMLDAGDSPNVQVWIDPHREPILVGVTDQRLHGQVTHSGNNFPSRARLRDAMLTHSRALSGWLRSRGYRGLAGFDFFEAEDPETGKATAFFAELNPRFNGASYPAALLDRLRLAHGASGTPPAAYATTYVKTTARSFVELARLLGDDLYTSASGSGAFPFSVARLARNACTVAYLAATVEEAEAGLSRVIGSRDGIEAHSGGRELQAESGPRVAVAPASVRDADRLDAPRWTTHPKRSTAPR